MYTRRRRAYFLLMGGCLVLFVSAWSFVRFYSIPAAVALTVVAMVIPPVAAIIGNRRGNAPWFDEKPYDYDSESDEPDDWWKKTDDDKKDDGNRPPE